VAIKRYEANGAKLEVREESGVSCKKTVIVLTLSIPRNFLDTKVSIE